MIAQTPPSPPLPHHTPSCDKSLFMQIGAIPVFSRSEGCAFIVILGNGSEVDLIARAYWGLKTEKWQGLGEVPCEFCCKHGKDSVETERLNTGMAPTCNWRIKIVRN